MESLDAGEILALLPAYNEATRAAPVVTVARTFLPVLVVDEGSQDETAAVARAAGADVYRQEPNQGEVQALRAGFGWALEKGYKAVIVLAADGQHNPGEIPAFLALHGQAHPDLIIGVRDFRLMPVVRRVANWLGSRTLAWALGQAVHDNQSGYRLLSRRLMKRTFRSAESGFEFEVEMIVTCVEAGYTLAWVPIPTIYGTAPSNIRAWQHFTNFLRIVRETRRRTRTAARSGR